ncbi:MAG: LD-carboxypeptidase [Acidobacteria bacterium]|nr:MAG: LD-carboxypeptidase [Acidobacteriota bacterium]
MSWARPRALRPGDLLGICAPAGAVDLGRLRRGMERLEQMGFRVKVGDAVAKRHIYTAGTVEERLADLQGLFADDEVAGVICARGGAGAGWLLPRLDLDLLRGHFKPFIGYSDVTCLHLVFNALELVTFHGPMVAWEFALGAFDERSWNAALQGGAAPYASEPGDLVCLRDGEAEGRLLGGCLSILAAAAGTRWPLRPDKEGTILFIEDVDEKPHKVDRMLLQLRSSGAFDGIRGLVFGDMKGCNPPASADFTLEDVIRESLSELDIPIALGLSSGHVNGPNVTLPLGVRARLLCHGEETRFEIVEASVE